MSHAGVPAQPDLDAIRELEALRHAFQAAPGNHRYRFQHLFLNVVDHPAARVRPQGMLMNPSWRSPFCQMSSLRAWQQFEA